MDAVHAGLVDGQQVAGVTEQLADQTRHMVMVDGQGAARLLVATARAPPSLVVKLSKVPGDRHTIPTLEAAVRLPSSSATRVCFA